MPPTQAFPEENLAAHSSLFFVSSEINQLLLGEYWILSRFCWTPR